MKRWAFRWLFAARIARRGLRRAPARSALIAILISLPIAGLAGTALVFASASPTVAERLTTQLGHTGTLLQVESAPDPTLQQDPVAPFPHGFTTQSDEGVKGEVDPAGVLPPATAVLRIGSTSATVTGPAAAVSATVISGPSWDKALRGRYDITAGHAPQTDGQVTITSALAEQLGAHPGSTVRAGGRQVTVTGIEEDRQAGAGSFVLFGSARAFPAVIDAGRFDGYSYYLPDTALTWAQIRALNRSGIVALSRTVALNPPRTSTAVQSAEGGFELDGTDVLAAIAVAFAVVQVLLLTGGAFAVGARTQRRNLAMLSATGADRITLVRVTTINGLLLGGIGGALGIVLGTAGGTVAMQIIQQQTGHVFPGWHFPIGPDVLLVLAAAGIGWIAAAFPARAAARLDVLAGLRGTRQAHRQANHPFAATVALAAGIVSAVIGVTFLVVTPEVSGQLGWAAVAAVVLITVAGILVQAAALLVAGRLLTKLADLFRSAPFPIRLGTRDVARNLPRTVPVIAAVMTTTFAAAFLITASTAHAAAESNAYRWQTQPGDASVEPFELVKEGNSSGFATTQRAATAFTRIVQQHLPVSHTWQINIPAGDNSGAGQAVPIALLDVRTDPKCPDQFRSPSSAACRYSSYPDSAGIAVGSPDTLSRLTGRPLDTATRAALDRGDAIALTRNAASDGTATVHWWTAAQYQKVLDQDGYTDVARNLSQVPALRTVHLSARTQLPERPSKYSLFITTATAQRIQLTTQPEVVIFSFTRTPDAAGLAATDVALNAWAENTYGQARLNLETGPDNTGALIALMAALAAGVIAFASALAAVGLARADSRPDETTLDSLGASPRVRRITAATQAVTLAGTGSITGTVLGTAAAYALNAISSDYTLTAPAPLLPVLAFGIPIAVALAAISVPRSTGARARRLRIA